MHHNYFILKQVAAALQRTLPGKSLEACFSNSREELYFGFESEHKGYGLNMRLLADQLLFTFPGEAVSRSRLFIPWFKELSGLKVLDVQAVPYDRFIVIRFEQEQQLVFKLFGRFSNIIHLADGEVVSVFRKQFEADLHFNPDLLKPVRSFHYDEAACSSPESFKQQYPFVPAEAVTYLSALSFFTQPVSEQENTFGAFRDMLENPEIYCMVSDDKVKLSLFKPSDAYTAYSHVTEAVNAFVSAWLRLHSYATTRQQLESGLKSSIKKKEHFIELTRQSLSELENKTSFEEIANIIMANLHAIPEGAEQAELLNFYTGEQIVIKLKQGITPQKLAEQYYRKAKNRHIEIQHLNTRIAEAEQQLEQYRLQLADILKSHSMAELKPFVKQQKKTEAVPELPYREFAIQQYTVWLGRHAKSNDALLRDAKKDDIWLHVKDHAGSHVLVRKHNSNAVPESVLQKAAAIAAYHSKARNHSLVPVIFTERKYVRKPKGAAAGEVLVEKEKVLLVAPENFN